MSGVWITKADGTRQLFDRRKVINTCFRLGADGEAAETIAKKVESRVYDGISTKKILQMVFRYLRKYRSAVRHQIDLREAISLLRPKPDFERFVRILLEEQGYKVTPNQIVQGRCVEHEIDAIARRNDETLLVEVKHHFNHHAYTGLDVPRLARATFEDLTEGYNLGLTPIKFTGALIVCNTKFSEHASRYARCRGINHIGWRAPQDQGLEKIIEEKDLYPITLLRDLSREERKKIADRGILLLKHLVVQDIRKLSEKTKIPQKRLQELIEKSSLLLK